MACGIIATSTLLAPGLPPAFASASVHTADALTTGRPVARLAPQHRLAHGQLASAACDVRFAVYVHLRYLPPIAPVEATMAGNLQDAISEAVAKTRAEEGILSVADTAVKLANAYGGDRQEIAFRITEAGIAAKINMKLDQPCPEAESAPAEHRGGAGRAES